MTRFTVDVITIRALKKLAKLETKLKKEGSLTVKELADLGKSYARVTAPNFAGFLIRGIKVFRGNKPDTYKIVSQNVGPRKWPNTGKYPNFSLPRWLDETGGKFLSNNPYGKAGTQHVPRHKARYMKATSAYLRQIAPGRAKKLKQNINFK